MFDKMVRAASDLRHLAFSPNSIPVVYFDKIVNVGDGLNPYLIPKISGRPIHRARTTLYTHVRAIGSLISSVNRHSYVWGSGSIDGKSPAARLESNRIRALRGHKTLALIHECGYSIDSIPLGDPALLMPRFFPGFRRPKTHRVGIIPHFSDLQFFFKGMWSIPNEAKVIDVRSEPETFISELLSCDFTISSSLHGLILSDAYEVPNVWISFPNELLGGAFKFLDYYSTTDDIYQDCAHAKSDNDLKDIVRDIISVARVKRFKYDLDDLLNSFPSDIWPYADARQSLYEGLATEGAKGKAPI